MLWAPPQDARRARLGQSRFKLHFAMEFGGKRSSANFRNGINFYYAADDLNFFITLR
jgi:hypothetical protein